MADAARSWDDAERFAQIQRAIDESEKFRAEQRKLIEEAAKFRVERTLYPAVVVGTVIATLLAHWLR
jgi:F0F1-type ATP synthase assembly protein I